MAATPSAGRKRSGRFRKVALSLPKAMSSALRAQGFASAGVLTDWPAIVGPELAANSCPESLSRDGALKLRVTGAVAPEVQHLEPQILEKIATYCGYRAVKRLVLIQGPLPPRDSLSSFETRPLAPKEKSELAREVENVARPGLKSALAGLGDAMRSRSRP